jgi:hypothetical protein
MTKLNALAEREIKRLAKTYRGAPDMLAREAMRYAYRHAAALCLAKSSQALAAMLSAEILDLIADMDVSCTLPAHPELPYLPK